MCRFDSDGWHKSTGERAAPIEQPAKNKVMKNYKLVIVNGLARKELKYKAGMTREKAIEVAKQMWQENFRGMSLYVYEDGVEIIAFES